jgi:hypothetical protein
MSNWVMFPEYRHEDKPPRNIMINLDSAKSIVRLTDTPSEVVRITFTDTSAVNVIASFENVSLHLGGFQFPGCL